VRFDADRSTLMRPNDVARLLAVSRAWVYEAARTGRIPSIRIGGDDGPLRFVPEDIERWLDAQRAEWTPGVRSGRRRPEPESRAADARGQTARRRSRATPLDPQSPPGQQLLL
jgi:excisionase family DNA binding protein